MKKRWISGLIILVVCIGIAAGWKIDENRKKHSVKTFTAFFTMNGDLRDSDNEIKQLIAEKIGAECEETWLSGQTAEEAVNYYIASGEYPDFISGGKKLYETGALIPIDEYWKEYPNIYNYLSHDEWEMFRQEDGHIYWLPTFGVVRGDDYEVIHDGEAFWIQTRVLKWAGYPKIRTMDEYFHVIEQYMQANPTMEDGTKNIPYTILCDDWRYFCLENVPQFLDGYPNDGSCMVDPDTLQVLDYNITPTAKKYFKKLNEEYQKGMVDPESFTNTYEEYLDKLSTGAVLGMIDQWWDFSYTIGPVFAQRNLREQGCEYVPLPITISKDIKNQWHVKRSNTLDLSSGLSITTSCEDINGALQFVNDLLDEEILRLRYWGVEGVDYEVNDKGEFFYLPEQKVRNSDEQLKTSHYCFYSFFPRKEGIMEDGINSYLPECQESLFYENLSVQVRECLQAYGCKNYVEMLGSNEKPGEWYPMYSYSNQLTYSTEAGRVWEAMKETKHIWLPRLVLADDFEKTWKQYKKGYKACQPEIFFRDMQRELNRRVKS